MILMDTIPKTQRRRQRNETTDFKDGTDEEQKVLHP
jgi:hypothetical protein